MQAAPKLNSMEVDSYITFRVGTANYALSVKFVQYIAARSSINARLTPSSDGGEARNLFDFENEAIALYRFNKQINASSQIDESEALIKLLEQRQQDHIDWIDALEKSIRTGAPFEKATDPHKCAFGQWYDNYKPEDEELKLIMEKFDAPHQRIHNLAKKLIDIAQNQNDVERAISLLEEERFTTLKDLLALFQMAKSRLEDMNKPVVLVLKTANRTFAIEVESLGDMQEFSGAHWLPSPNEREQACYSGFFQKEKGDLYLNLVPENFLTLYKL